MSALVRVASARRGGLDESHHFAAAAVTTPDGRLVARLGDPGFATFVRSSAKPFQALPLVEAGGVERFALTDADLALVCASHAGLPRHVEAARSLLERGGFGVGDLQCGAHRPLDAAAARALDAAGEEPTPLHNNCSGKHAGMLLACRVLELPTTTYLDPEHPLQRRIRQRLALFAGVGEDDLGVAVDGCSAPTFHTPLVAAARAYAALVAPELSPPVAAAGSSLAAACRRIVEAMTGCPEQVAGPGRFTTRLMQVSGGRLLGKEGAEGFYGVGVRGPVALGVALKIADGGERARDGVVLDLLHQLGVLSRQELAALEDLRRPILRNHRGLEVGDVLPDFELEEA
jgi:L-asparaginase II